jgi:hypothetical protein
MKTSTSPIKLISSLIIASALMIVSANANAVTTDCSSNLSSANTTYTLSANTSNTCNITANGITLDAQGHTISHTPLALPNNAVNNSWLDMTGNFGLYHMDDTFPTIAESVSGHNAAIAGSIVSAANGKFGRAVTINDNSGGAIQAGTISGLTTTQTKTFWFRLDNLNFDQTIIDEGGNIDRAQITEDRHPGEYKIRFYNGGDVLDSNRDFTSSDYGVWHFGVVTYDSSTGIAQIYIDGSLDTSANTGGTGTPANVSIGVSPYGGTLFNGSLDEIGLWNRVLTSGEISSLYNSGTGRTLVGNESGLVALYHMDDTNVGPVVVSDSSGQGNGITVTGAVSSAPSGEIGKGLSFDGNEDIYVQPVTSLSATPNMTMSVWVNPSGSNPTSMVMYYGSYVGESGDFHASIRLENDNVFHFDPGSEWSCDDSIYGSPTANINAWHMVTATMNSGVLTLYVDGAQVAQANQSCTASSAVNQPVLSFGNGQNQNGNIWGYFDGLMDEGAIWSRALSSGEVSTMYNTQSAGIAINGNGHGFSVTNLTATGLIESHGASVTVSNSTVSVISVSGSNATGNAEAGGTINLTSTTAGALLANGGNSTDNGVGGAAGSLGTISASTYTSFTAVKGSCGPNSLDASCPNIFTDQGSGDWDDPSNWSKGSVPTDGTEDVIIKSSVPYVGNGDAFVHDIDFISGVQWDPYSNYNGFTFTGTATFESGSVFNYGQISGSGPSAQIIFNGNSYANCCDIYSVATTTYNGSSYTYASLHGNTSFAVFNDSSNASCGYFEGNVIFNGSSLADGCGGTINGTATFNGSSYNYYENFNGPVTYVGDNTEFYEGQINTPPPIRYYNTSVSPSRDFVNSSGAPWEIVADGAVVNLSGSTCDSNTTFSALNGGTFIFGGNCQAGPPKPVIIRPTANSVNTTWSPQITWNEGSGGYNWASCQYSFGQSIDWNANTSEWNNGSPEVGTWKGASCTGNGSDISAPTTYGSQILAIRAFYLGTPTSTIQLFTYTPSRNLYFYNNGSNANWSTVGNWYLDSAHASSSGALPTSIDKVTVVGSTAPSVNLDSWVQPALINSGTVGISFTSASSASTSVSINGKTTYNGSAKNKGIANGIATFNGTSVNQGIVTSNATFNSSSQNTGTVRGNATFNGETPANSGTVVGIKTRYYSANATTTRNFVGWTVVADGAIVNISSSTIDATTVLRTLNGGSFIGGPTTVYWKGTVSGDPSWTRVSNWFSDASTTIPLGHVASSTASSSETVITLGTIMPIIDVGTSTWNTPAGIDASRTGLIVTASTTLHINTGITGSTTLSGSVINDGPISGTTTLLTSAQNSSIGVIFGNAYFYNSTQNNGGFISGDAYFYNSSQNKSSGSVSGDATFYNSSFNASTAGTINGTATFNDTSHNDGTIAYNAVFGNNLSENNGTVAGLKTRYFSIATTTSRDFVATGPWKLVADGVTVTLSNSSVFSATSTTFTTLNGGAFAGEGFPGLVTCAKPLVFPGTYTLSGNTSNTCIVQSTGITIDGSNHAINHTPFPFPNNAVSTSSVDMTNNNLLYHLNETLPAFVDSAVQGGNTGSVIGGTATTTGKLGGGVSFDGSTGFGLISGPPSLTYPSGSFSVSFWVKSNGSGWSGSSNADWLGLVGNSINYGDGWGIRQYGGTHHIEMGFYATSNGFNDTEGTHVVDDGSWHYVVGTYNASTHQVTVYVDNQVDSSYSISGSLVTAHQPIYLAYESQYNYRTAMKLDELSFWNKALSSGEVSTQYNSGNGTVLTGNESNLVSLYHFNESTYTSTTTTAADSSGHSVNATIIADGAGPTTGYIGGTTGVFSNGFNFNGTGHLKISSGTVWNSSKSISFWIRPSDSSSGFIIIKNHNFVNSYGALTIGSYFDGSGNWITGTPGKFYWRANNQTATVGSTGSVSAGVWSHVVVVFNSSAVTFYINGQFAGSYSGNYSMGDDTTFDSNVNTDIGAYVTENGPSHYLNGMLDEVAIFDRSLTSSDVTNIYNSQTNGVTVDGGSYNINVTNLLTGGVISSPGASVTISNSTINTVTVSGASAVGDGQRGGTINLVNTQAGALLANGGDSTDYGYGGAGGTITLDGSSSATSQSNHAGANGPNLHTGQQNTGGSSSGSSVSGCTDPSATNYNASATVDNGSCVYSYGAVRGCTDPSATNYNPNATVNNGTCSYVGYSNPAPVNSGGGNSGSGGNSNNNPAFNGVSLSINSSATGSLYLKPLPGFSFGVDGAGNTILGNPLAGLKPLGALDLKGINFSFTLPISSFLFAPLPQSIVTALSKAPKLSETLASVGISRAQDLVKLNREPIKLPVSLGGLTPGLFTVVDGTTTLDTFIANDPRHDIVEMVGVHPGDVLKISLVPLIKGNVLATFDDKIIQFASSGSQVVATLVVPEDPGRYILATDAAPLALAVDVSVPVQQVQQSSKSLSWWQKILSWFGKSP